MAGVALVDERVQAFELWECRKIPIGSPEGFDTMVQTGCGDTCVMNLRAFDFS